jgi:hypothetical protein
VGATTTYTQPGIGADGPAPGTQAGSSSNTTDVRAVSTAPRYALAHRRKGLSRLTRCRRLRLSGVARRVQLPDNLCATAIRCSTFLRS